MSVYIKDMEMPVDCLACRVACDKESYMVVGRPPKCPLAEAPDGDLIGRAETIQAVELMEIFLGERKKNAVIRGIQALPSAEAVSREDYEETDGVIAIEKQSAKDVGKIKHIIIRSPNYTRYFYNESMPIPNEQTLPSAEAVQGWIPCSERLPEKDELVLVTVWNGVSIAWRNIYGGWESAEDMYEKGDVTAWMPLPTPYKGGDDK